MAIDNCINCGVKPVIERQQGYYAFILKHPVGALCYPTFRLKCHQHTRAKCISHWNKFNKLNNRKGTK